MKQSRAKLRWGLDERMRLTLEPDPRRRKIMSISVEKFGKQEFTEVNGKRMAYIDEGAGSVEL